MSELNIQEQAESSLPQEDNSSTETKKDKKEKKDKKDKDEAYSDPDFIPINKPQFTLNLKKFLAYAKTKVMEDFKRIDISSPETIQCCNGLELYLKMINTTEKQDAAKHKNSWSPEHSEHLKELFENNMYDIIEDPPTHMWLGMDMDVQTVFGSSLYAQTRFANGEKRFREDAFPILYLSKIIDSAEKVSTHYKNLTIDDPEEIKRKTPQIKYHGMILLYLYNIFYNNCTSKDRRAQLLKIIRDMEVVLGLRQKASNNSGGGLGNLLGGLGGGEGGLGGVLGNVVEKIAPAMKNVMENSEGKGAGELLQDMMNDEGVKDVLNTVSGALQGEGGGEGVNPNQLADGLASAFGLGSDSSKRVNEFAQQALAAPTRPTSSSSSTVPE